MTKCHAEDNNIVNTWRIQVVVSSKSHNFFFTIQDTNEKRKCFRHIVIGTGDVPDNNKRNTNKSYKQNI